MSNVQLRIELETRLSNLMVANYPDVEINWENSDMTEDQVIIAPIILSGRKFVSSIGRKSTRQSGIFQIDVLVPTDTGSGVLEELCEFIGTYFEAKRYDLTGHNAYVTMDEASPKYLGVRSGKYRKAVSIPYVIDTFT